MKFYLFPTPVFSKSKVIIASIIFLVLFPFPDIGDKLLWEPITNSVHIFLGAVFFLLLRLFFFRRNVLDNLDNLLIFLLSVSVGGAIEAVQPLFGRSKSVDDIALTMVGCGVILFSTYWHEVKYRKVKIISLFTVLFFTAIHPIYQGFKFSELKEQAMPQIVFPHFVLNRFISTSPGVEVFRDVGSCALIAKSHNMYDAIEVPVGDQNWSNYEYLVVEGINLDIENSIIGMRVDSLGSSTLYGERFNKKFSLDLGKFMLEVKISEIKDQVRNKTFSVEHVKRIILFKSDLNPQTAICLSKVYLR